MAYVTANRDLPAQPEAVWRLIGGFGSLPDWHPLVQASEASEGGRIRRIFTTDDRIVVERLLAFDDAERTYSYTMEQSPATVTSHHATISVSAQGNGARVEWTTQFVPFGVTETEAVQAFTEVFDSGLDALLEYFSQPTR